MKAIEQYFPVVLFTVLYKVVPTFESVDEIPKCDHSNERYWAVLSLVLFLMLYKVGSNFWVCGWNPKVWPFKWKLLSSTFLWCCLLLLYKVVLTFEFVDEILKCDHSSESYWAVLSCGVVYYAVQGGSNVRLYGWNPKVWPFKWKLLSSTFLWCCLLLLYKVVLTFESVDEILKCDHSNESCWAVRSFGAVYYCCARWF